MYMYAFTYACVHTCVCVCVYKNVYTFMSEHSRLLREHRAVGDVSQIHDGTQVYNGATSIVSLACGP